MPFKKEPKTLLADILADIERIRSFTQGVTLVDFQKEDSISYGVKYALLRISEAAHRLGDAADIVCPGVAWRDIRGLGNRLRHAYDSIETDLIWVIVERDLDVLEKVIRNSLK